MTTRRVGAHYEETRHLSAKDISALIRADIRQATKTGSLPSDWKYSVRLDRFAGGCAIDVTIIVPEEVIELRREFPGWYQHTQYRDELVGKYKPLARLADTERIVEEIHESYNFYESYFPADGCASRYFGRVSTTWRVTA